MNNRNRDADVLIVGAGIAGAALAASLTTQLKVIVVDQEPSAGYHATGRSVAVFSEVYGSAAVRALSRGTRPFLLRRTADGEPSLMRRCGVLFIARTDQAQSLESLSSKADVSKITSLLSKAAAHELMPVLRPNYLEQALLEPEAAEIDVHGLHQGYLRVARSNGTQILLSTGVLAIERHIGRWSVVTRGGSYRADILVNAAGAWADQIASLAGVSPLNIEPRRRTVAVIDAPPGMQTHQWPMTVDIDESFYIKPEAARLIISPADETPSAACDCHPDDYDVALAVARIEAATTLQVTRVTHAWAGLRSFAPDRNPVIGFDAGAANFFWLAGQGGYGIQTSYSAALLADALIRGTPLPTELIDTGLSLDEVLPKRFSMPRKATATI